MAVVRPFRYINVNVMHFSTIGRRPSVSTIEMKMCNFNFRNNDIFLKLKLKKKIIFEMKVFFWGFLKEVFFFLNKILEIFYFSKILFS